MTVNNIGLATVLQKLIYLTPSFSGVLSLFLYRTLITLFPSLLLQSSFALSFYLLLLSNLCPTSSTSLFETLSLSAKLRTPSNPLSVSLSNLCTPLLCPFLIKSFSLRKVKTLIAHGRSTIKTTRSSVKIVQQLAIVKDGVVEELKVFEVVDTDGEASNGFEKRGNTWFRGGVWGEGSIVVDDSTGIAVSRGFVHVALHEEALKGIAMTLKDFGEVVDGFRVEADVQGGNMATKEKLYVGLELGDNFGLRA
ncbi:hypothetical protein JHK82_014795 [Glycine max]|uniref:Uncharacterized protein n=1 Tax=Glycine soja TaxID=3848 RepID=A0A445K712_GLYSO|nr:hypothetical protein JHK82_014795 [Glycine max]RZC06601.1 hypothetical protein D0Y65_014190 [Glycine soja]